MTSVSQGFRNLARINEHRDIVTALETCLDDMEIRKDGRAPLRVYTESEIKSLRGHEHG